MTRRRGTEKPDGRTFRTVTDIRHEIIRIYNEVKRSRMKSDEGQRRVRILETAAHLMTETEPEVELRHLRQEHEKLLQLTARLEARLEMVMEAKPDEAWQSTKPTPAILLPPAPG